MSRPGSTPDEAPPVEVRFHLPAPDLRPLITSYYAVDIWRGPLTDYMHPEWGNMRFFLSGAWGLGEPGPWRAPAASLFGPTDRTIVLHAPEGSVIGVGMTPLGWAQLIRRDAEALANRGLALGDALGEPGAGLLEALCAAPDDAGRTALLDEALLLRLADAPPADEAAVRLGQALVSLDLRDTAAFADAVGVSTRTLDRLCRRTFGFAPKRLLRRQRFLRTLDAIGDRLDRPLGEMLDHGYHDQAHFIREFKSYMGMTPSAYYASPREVLRRAAKLRTETIGASMQGLHGAAESPGDAS
jgi:AraC-like DNA-binding protein